MELMKSSSKALSEIAIDCGFSDQAHMCRQFRRATGVSPNAWRRDNMMMSELATRQ
jgi:AraC-like DNA-binding protein